MSPPRSLARSVADGVVVWVALALTVLTLELALGTWALADLSRVLESGDLLSFAASGAATLVLVAGGVTCYLRWGLVAPLVALVVYVGYFAALGLTAGVPTWPFVAALYGSLVAPVFALLAGVEYLFRRRRGRPSPG